MRKEHIVSRGNVAPCYEINTPIRFTSSASNDAWGTEVDHHLNIAAATNKLNFFDYVRVHA